MNMFVCRCTFSGEAVILTPRVDEDLTGYEIINLTQIALGAKPGKGAHTLFIQTTGMHETGGHRDDRTALVSALCS